MDADTYGAALDAAAQRAYVARGRPLAHLADDALAERWTAAYRAWALTGDRDQSGIEDNARCELMLRGLRVPIEAVTAEMAAQLELAEKAWAEGRIDTTGLVEEFEEIEAELARKH